MIFLVATCLHTQPALSLSLCHSPSLSGVVFLFLARCDSNSIRCRLTGAAAGAAPAAASASVNDMQINFGGPCAPAALAGENLAQSRPELCVCVRPVFMLFLTVDCFIEMSWLVPCKREREVRGRRQQAADVKCKYLLFTFAALVAALL